MNKPLIYLIKRNLLLYFKDKSTFYTSLISPLIIFFLYITFLKSVYASSLIESIPESFEVQKEVLEAFTSSWLMSSLIAVSSVTVAFCANTIMAVDKINFAIADIYITPIKRSTVSLAYLISNYIATLIICLLTVLVGFIYISLTGWYFSFVDVILIISDVFLATLFGTVLSSFCTIFIKSQGGVTAIGSLVSSIYGFLCGAYMPLSQFSSGIRNFISILPGTYSTGLLRNHYLSPVLKEFDGVLPQEIIKAVKDGFDVNLYLFDKPISSLVMYIVVIASIIALLTGYIIVNNKISRKEL